MGRLARSKSPGRSARGAVADQDESDGTGRTDVAPNLVRAQGTLVGEHDDEQHSHSALSAPSATRAGRGRRADLADDDDRWATVPSGPKGITDSSIYRQDDQQHGH